MGKEGRRAATSAPLATLHCHSPCALQDRKWGTRGRRSLAFWPVSTAPDSRHSGDLCFSAAPSVPERRLEAFSQCYMFFDSSDRQLSRDQERPSPRIDTYLPTRSLEHCCSVLLMGPSLSHSVHRITVLPPSECQSDDSVSDPDTPRPRPPSSRNAATTIPRTAV